MIKRWILRNKYLYNIYIQRDIGKAKFHASRDAISVRVSAENLPFSIFKHCIGFLVYILAICA